MNHVLTVPGFLSLVLTSNLVHMFLSSILWSTLIAFRHNPQDDTYLENLLGKAFYFITLRSGSLWHNSGHIVITL